ncbi:hypothetical protein [Methylocaldum sp. 14B]|uniref:hypothetical protein n=1 Tax=Methylocaldum sp. 14B TaxID=1912213 RepID=UPI00098B1FBE|nr:hypothetical protein [Methylocaldum sp. 14B]
MKDSFRKLVTISGVMGSGLLGLLPSESFAQGDLVRGQEVALTECSGWLIQSSTAPAIESNAVYWFLQGLPAHPPGGHFRFRAEFPQARYLSWQNHDFLGNSTALLADTDIVPDRGENPFLPNTPYVPESAYTVDLLDIRRPRPPQPPRPANILYGGYRYDGSKTEYNSVAYRVYLPDPGTDSLGGIPQPDFYFVVDDPAMTSLEGIHEMCEKMRRIQEAEKQALIRLVESAESSEETRETQIFPAERDELRLRVIDGPSAAGGIPSPSASDFNNGLARYRAVTPHPNGRGTYYNAQTGYLLVFLSPSRGEVTVMRFRAPSFPDTQGLEGIPDDISGNEQLRYWSLCMHNTSTLWTTNGCLYDAQAAQDGDGYVTFAFSNPESRPANAANWLPTTDTIPALILRHMQPNPAFAEALLYYAGTNNDPAAITAHMGEYFPLVTTCTKVEFERDRCGLAADAQ